MNSASKSKIKCIEVPTWRPQERTEQICLVLSCQIWSIGDGLSIYIYGCYSQQRSRASRNIKKSRQNIWFDALKTLIEGCAFNGDKPQNGILPNHPDHNCKRKIQHYLYLDVDGQCWANKSIFMYFQSILSTARLQISDKIMKKKKSRYCGWVCRKCDSRCAWAKPDVTVQAWCCPECASELPKWELDLLWVNHVVSLFVRSALCTLLQFLCPYCIILYDCRTMSDPFLPFRIVSSELSCTVIAFFSSHNRRLVCLQRSACDVSPLPVSRETWISIGFTFDEYFNTPAHPRQFIQMIYFQSPNILLTQLWIFVVF